MADLDLTAIPQRTIKRATRIAMWSIAAVLLCLPLVAMQFTGEVDWTLGDFLVFAGMLLVLLGVIEIVLRHAADRWLRAIGIALALAGFAFVWGMLAVG